MSEVPEPEEVPETIFDAIWAKFLEFSEQLGLPVPPKPQLLPLPFITNLTWDTRTWSLDEGSYAKIENGIFKALATKEELEPTGASVAEQGIMPHEWHECVSQLIHEPIITIGVETPIILKWIGKRTSAITWLSDETNHVSNVGCTLWGDVGLDYHNPDRTVSGHLAVDFVFDHVPSVPSERHWKHYEHNYYSQFILGSMPRINFNYAFRTRIDLIIQKALAYWYLNQFTLKYVQFWLEARGSRASIEISLMQLGFP